MYYSFQNVGNNNIEIFRFINQHKSSETFNGQRSGIKNKLKYVRVLL